MVDSEELLQLDIQEDFAEKLATGRPAQALTELAWNALDAEAGIVKITADAGLIGLDSVTVYDNGHGMTWQEARELFRNLGGSWKKANQTSKNGRRNLHGKEGRGRLRALAIGRVAEWRVTGKGNAGSFESFTITIVRDDMRNVRISRPVASSDGHTGTIVK